MYTPSLETASRGSNLRIAISQSNYIPWKGYFDLINSVDVFVIFDEMQYTKRDWRNRNRIKTPAGTKWLSIPVFVTGKFFQKISETQAVDSDWRKKHWSTILHSYARTAHFRDYADLFSAIYLTETETCLSEINISFIRKICEILEIKTAIKRSSDFEMPDGKTERLVSICKQASAKVYYSGPAAKSYIDPNLFLGAGIELRWMDYSNYPVYPQLFPPFDHFVSVFDLIFNTGPKAKMFMKSFGESRLDSI